MVDIMWNTVLSVSSPQGPAMWDYRFSLYCWSYLENTQALIALQAFAEEPDSLIADLVAADIKVKKGTVDSQSFSQCQSTFIAESIIW